MKGNLSKNNNTVEISVFGRLNKDIDDNISSPARQNYYSTLNEEFKNDCFNFIVVKTTYRYEKKDSMISKISNLADVYQYYETQNADRELIPRTPINFEKFCQEVNYMQNLNEYLMISNCYIKYISNNAIKNPAFGRVKIVELARCDDNIGLTLKKLGFQDVGVIKYVGEIIKYNQENILLTMYSFGEAYKPVELSCICKESEIDANSKKMKLISQKLEKYLVINKATLVGRAFREVKSNSINKYIRLVSS